MGIARRLSDSLLYCRGNAASVNSNNNMIPRRDEIISSKVKKH